jgi:polysaccharide pyruvyl transferase WcaK-like protein
MNEDRPLFILAGNGPYENLGCEAIVRGTVKILREYFNDPRFICLSHFHYEEQYKRQRLQETDRAIVHLTTHRIGSRKKIIQNLWKPEVWQHVYQHFFNQAALKSQVYRDMLPYLDNADAVLSIGGDNYSLDYGVPTLFTGLDDLVLEKGRPLAIWGASIGPFDRIPKYEKYMSRHLREITGIFARESATIDYLKGIGVTENVHHVADPAFLMDAVPPVDKIPIERGAIGINLSPLVAKYISCGDQKQWTKIAASIIAEVAKRTERQIYLIPHVVSQSSNDYAFMQKALSFIPDNSNLTLIPPTYNAAETKWIISQMTLFAGARTHSTIAALSSGVPTLSFAYSIKAWGINMDTFGHSDYCLEPRSLDTEAVFVQISSMLDDDNSIRRKLTERIPEIQRAALNAGMVLKQLVGEN